MKFACKDCSGIAIELIIARFCYFCVESSFARHRWQSKSNGMRHCERLARLRDDLLYCRHCEAF